MSKKEIEAIEEVMLSEDVPETPFLDMREVQEKETRIEKEERLKKFMDWISKKKVANYEKLNQKNIKI
jgi:hypothetical protein